MRGVKEIKSQGLPSQRCGSKDTPSSDLMKLYLQNKLNTFDYGQNHMPSERGLANEILMYKSASLRGKRERYLGLNCV